jgi:hypothetical protein
MDSEVPGANPGRDLRGLGSSTFRARKMFLEYLSSRLPSGRKRRGSEWALGFYSGLRRPIVPLATLVSLFRCKCSRVYMVAGSNPVGSIIWGAVAQSGRA